MKNGFIRVCEFRQLPAISIWVCFFTPKLIWTKAKEELAAQTRRALFTLYNVQSKLGTFSTTEAFKLCDIMILPILTYAAEIWGYDYSIQIEKVHDLFCAQFLNLLR